MLWNVSVISLSSSLATNQPCGQTQTSCWASFELQNTVKFSVFFHQQHITCRQNFTGLAAIIRVGSLMMCGIFLRLYGVYCKFSHIDLKCRKFWALAHTSHTPFTCLPLVAVMFCGVLRDVALAEVARTSSRKKVVPLPTAVTCSIFLSFTLIPTVCTYITYTYGYIWYISV